MLLQFLPKAPERARQADLHPGDAPEGGVTHTVAEDDAWVEGQSLISTVEDVELIDPDLYVTFLALASLIAPRFVAGPAGGGAACAGVNAGNTGVTATQPSEKHFAITCWTSIPSTGWRHGHG